MGNTTETSSPTQEKTMSETTTETKKTKKGKKAAKAASNGHSQPLRKLERKTLGMTRTVQETFRTTPEEHNQLVAMAEKDGFGSMSDFFRSTLGLDK